MGNVGEGQPIWAKRGEGGGEGTCGEFAHQGLRWERLFRGGVGVGVGEAVNIEEY